MITNTTRTFTFTKEGIEKVLTEYVAKHIDEPHQANRIKDVSWEIKEGVTGGTLMIKPLLLLISLV